MFVEFNLNLINEWESISGINYRVVAYFLTCFDSVELSKTLLVSYIVGEFFPLQQSENIFIATLKKQPTNPPAKQTNK